MLRDCRPVAVGATFCRPSIRGSLPSLGILDELAVEGAERVERGLGKRAAFRALAPLVDSMRPGRPRARAHLRAMVVAAQLEEGIDLELLAARWEQERFGRHRDVKAAVRELLGVGEAESAALVAEAESVRVRGDYEEGSAYYVLGRALEEAGRRAEATRALDRAADHASDQPKLRRAAQARALRVCDDPDEAAQRAVALLPLEGGLPADRLSVAVAALGAPGRYRRAAALDVLDELAARRGPVGRAAIRQAARHADESGPGLGEIELDRVRAVLLRHPHEGIRVAALGRLEALAAYSRGEVSGARVDPESAPLAPRAKAVLEGASPGPRPAEPRARVGWTALAVIDACGHGRVNEARQRLREARALILAGARVEGVLWTAARVGMDLVPAAATLLVQALSYRTGEPPSRGFRPLADALLAAGAEEEGLAMLRRAARRREPGARERLAAHLRHAGWREAERGDRARALALLREAKRLAR